MSIEVIKSTDQQLIGLKGSIIDETKHMLVITSEKKNQPIKIQKKNSVFRFILPSGESVEIDGRMLDMSNENRLKNIIRKRW